MRRTVKAPNSAHSGTHLLRLPPSPEHPSLFEHSGPHTRRQSWRHACRHHHQHRLFPPRCTSGLHSSPAPSTVPPLRNLGRWMRHSPLLSQMSHPHRPLARLPCNPWRRALHSTTSTRCDSVADTKLLSQRFRRTNDRL